MPRILALETATEACSAALWLDGELTHRFSVLQRGHAEHILPMVDALLAEAGLPAASLDAIAVGRGPGAFTGVRIGVSVAQGLAYGLGLPVLPVSTLRALAWGGREAARAAGASAILAALDARMGELYLGRYDLADPELAPLADEALLRPEAMQPHEMNARAWYCIGRGCPHLPHLTESASVVGADGDALPSAASIAELAALDFARGVVVPPERLEPVYLRDRVTG